MLPIFITVTLTCLLVSSSLALDNGLARRPPMGWLTWERFRCLTDCENFPADCIAERLILETADRMASDGWLQAGYEYITIDDCWPEMSRAPNGSLVPDKKRFPRGMKYIGDYVHRKGLKFGIYEDFGTKTCGGYPGSEFYMQLDANTFADWGVDLVKLDGCYSEPGQQKEGYGVFGFYLNQTGRPILYSCSYPAYNKMPDIDAETLKTNCNMWRMFDDIDDSWASVLKIINFYKANQANFATWAGPGHWNDPDMLIIGNFGLSWDQQRVQMGMWAIFAAPLILSVDLRTIRPESRELLQHRELLRINQDPLGQQGTFVKEQGNMQLWQRTLSDSLVAAVLNTNDDMPRRYLLKLSDLKLKSQSAQVNAIDVFSGDNLGTFNPSDSVPLVVNPTGIRIVKLLQ